MRLLLVAMGARRMRGTALAALLALACQRNLTPVDPPSSGQGPGGSRASGTGAAGGNGGSRIGPGGSGGPGGSPGPGGSGGPGGLGGPGGSRVIDAGADRTTTPVDAGGPDRTPDVSRPPDASGCPVDCNHLPHVRSDLGTIACVSGKCLLPPNACQPGFGNCSGNANTGCESDLSTNANCGFCGFNCNPAGANCIPYAGTFVCAPRCTDPLLTQCGFGCFDLQTDPNNCGTCGNGCYLPNADVACQNGKCVFLACTDPQFLDCTDEPGCETESGNVTSCGGCGDPACTTANTMFTCADGGMCGDATCASGFANCNTANPDCEVSFASPPASGGSCLPHYLGTMAIATQIFNTAVTAIAPDGSFFLAGTFTGSVDFDPSSNRDVRTANDSDGFITKFNADGSYAWTATFTGRGQIALNSLALAPSGNIVIAGFYSDTVDFDPGTASDLHFTATADQNDAYVVELAPNGTLVWARTFSGNPGAFATGVGVAVDGAGAVYASGSFLGDVDFDPGAGTKLLSALWSSGFVVKLTAAGNFAWANMFDNGACEAQLVSVAVAQDGNVWATGTAAAGVGCTIPPVPPPSLNDPQFDLLLVRLSPAGDTLSVRTFGNLRNDYGVALAASADGAMYLGGNGSGEIVFDPGPPPVRRWLAVNGAANFVLKLSASGAPVWVRALNGPNLDSIAATADGGVLAAGMGENGGAFVSRFTATGGSVWTFAAGEAQASALSISSAGSAFMIGGTSFGTVDLDPGPAIDPVFGDITFLSRFTF